MNKPETSAECSRFVVEQNQRLSRSVLWSMQRNYFKQQGIEAWRQGTVPHYITSNPFIADTYVQVVLGFLRDCNSAATTLDQRQPIYIIELGSGSGRFAFHFLKRFQRVYERSVVSGMEVKYVMTDFATQTLQYWDSHPSLQPFIGQGCLDFAHFDASHDQELKLSHAGVTLYPGSVKNPLIILANYFFDSIPQDAFKVMQGQLYESLITVTSPQSESDLADPEALNHIEIAFDHRPINGHYYEDESWNEILRDYKGWLADTTILFPCDAIHSIRDLSHLSNGRLLLLSADKGYSHEEDLLGRGDPRIDVHGSFSMMVNYHAIGQYVRNQGGHALNSTHRHNALEVSAFILGHSPDSTIETHQAYAAAVEQFGPDDFFTIKQSLRGKHDTLTFREILAYLRLSGWDANIFLECFPVLLDQVDCASETNRQELYRAIQQVWDTYFPIGEKHDLAFSIGMLLYGMAYYTEALEYFRHSLKLYGSDASTLYNMGMCYLCLHQLEDALECIDQASILDPAFDEARTMRVRIQAESNCWAGSENLLQVPHAQEATISRNTWPAR